MKEYYTFIQSKLIELYSKRLKLHKTIIFYKKIIGNCTDKRSDKHFINRLSEVELQFIDICNEINHIQNKRSYKYFLKQGVKNSIPLVSQVK